MTYRSCLLSLWLMTPTTILDEINMTANYLMVKGEIKTSNR